MSSIGNGQAFGHYDVGFTAFVWIKDRCAVRHSLAIVTPVHAGVQLGSEAVDLREIKCRHVNLLPSLWLKSDP